MARWLVFGGILAIAVILRLHDLESICLWPDETDFFNSTVYGGHPKPLVAYALETGSHTTSTAAWPGLVWIAAHTAGNTARAARLPSALGNAAAVLAIFLLLWYLGRSMPSGQPYPVALFGAVLAAISIIQLEVSQRAYPYAIVPVLSATLAMAHLNIWQEWRRTALLPYRLAAGTAVYAVLATFSIFMNLTMCVAVGISTGVLALSAAREGLRKTSEERWLALGLAIPAGVCLVLAILLNAKSPQLGYRYYIDWYYHAPGSSAVAFLLTRAYDLFTYHLDLYYNEVLYWPRRLNPMLLPLVLNCIAGWVLAAAGRFGALVRHLAILAAAGVTTVAFLSFRPALLSVRAAFPFGGVRQTMFLEPYLISFTALGFYSLWRHRRLRRPAMALAAIYLALWAVNLPAFYRDRVVRFQGAELAEIAARYPELPVYSLGGNEESIRYLTRRYRFPVIPLNTFAEPIPRPPFLMVSLNWPIEHDLWDPGLAKKLRAPQYDPVLLVQHPARHLNGLAYPTSVYFPPSGLWVYLVNPGNTGVPPLNPDRNFCGNPALGSGLGPLSAGSTGPPPGARSRCP